MLILSCLTALSLRGQEETPFTRLFDTGAASAQPLAAEAIIKRAGWTQVPEDKVDHPFAGDAVLVNDKLTVVLRKQGRGAEVYSKAASGPKRRASLGYAGAGFPTAGTITALKIIENTSSSVMIEATSKGAAPATLRFRLTTGESILEVRPGTGAGAVVVQSSTHYVVVPDYFGDDMVFETGVSPHLGGRSYTTPTSSNENGARVTRPSELVVGQPSYLPAENMCLNLLDGGDAILMTVWQSSAQDTWLAPVPALRAPSPPLGERDGVRGRGLTSSDDSTALHIQCLPGKSIWLAFLESPSLWHTGTATAKDDWQPPFPAKWRCSLMREHGVADSWEFDQRPTPESSSGARTNLSALARGSVAGPDKIVRAPHAPLLIYPLDRSAATPLTTVLPTDVMRNTLGVGPCQYILACEGMAAQGDPTPNSVMNWVEKQFEQKKDRKTSDDIKERLDVMVKHIGEARTKIEGYAGFTRQVRKIVTGKTGADEVGPILEDLERFAATGLAAPATPQRARQLADDVAALIGKENSLAACQRLGEQLRSIGTVQDGALARCRMAVRRLKQQGRTLAANPSQEASLAGEVRRMAEQMLKEKSGSAGKHEGAKQ